MIELHELTGEPRELVMAVYETGYRAGLDRGRELAEADMQAVWTTLAAKVRAMANQPTLATLADRRGEPERAARTREIERRVMA